MGGFNVDCDRDLSFMDDFPLELNDRALKVALRYPQIFEAKDGNFLSYKSIIYQMAVHVMAFKAITKEAGIYLPQTIVDLVWDYARINPVVQMCHSDIVRNGERHLTIRRMMRTYSLFFMMRKMTELFKSKYYRQVVIAGNRCYEILSPEYACPLSPVIESEYEGNVHFMIPVLTIGRHTYVSENGERVTRYEEREQAEGLQIFCIMPSFIEKGNEEQSYKCFVSVKINHWTANFTTSTVRTRSDATSIMLSPKKVAETGIPYFQQFGATTNHFMVFENNITELPAEADELASGMPLVSGIEISVRPGDDISPREENDLRNGTGWLGARLYTTRNDDRDLAARCIDPLCDAYHFSGTTGCHPYYVVREEAEREYDYLHQQSHKWDDSKSQFVAALAYEKSERGYATINQFIEAADKILGKPTSPTLKRSAFKSYNTINLFIKLTNDKKGENEAFLKETIPFAKKLIAAKIRLSHGIHSWDDEIEKAKREQQNVIMSLNSPSNKRFPMINDSPSPSPTPPKCYLGADHPQRLALQNVKNKNLGLPYDATLSDKPGRNPRESPPLYLDPNALIKISNKGSNVKISFKNVSSPLTSEDEEDDKFPATTTLNDKNDYDQTELVTTSTQKTITELTSEKTSDYKQSQTTTTVTPTIADHPTTTTSTTNHSNIIMSNLFKVQQMMDATDYAFSPPSPKQQNYDPNTLQQEEEETSSSEEQEDNPKYNIGYKETVARLTQVTPKCTQRGSFKPLHEWQGESEHEMEEQERGEEVKMLNLKRAGYTLLKASKKKGTELNNSKIKPSLSNKRTISETMEQTPNTSTSKVNTNTNTNDSSGSQKMEKRKNKRRRINSPSRKNDEESTKNTLSFS